MLSALSAKKTFIKKTAVVCVLMSSGLLASQVSVGEEPQAVDVPPTTTICAIPGVPPSDFKYKVIKKLKLGKGSYGSVTDIQPNFARLALNSGADAVIYYNGSQRFGFFPWRVVRPVITGTAIQWDKGNAKAFSCKESGGIYL